VRVSLLSLAAVLMVPPIYMAASLGARKWKTGRFLLTREEAAAKRAEVFGKMGAGKPFGPQAWIWVFPVVFGAMFLGLGILAIVGAVVVGGSSVPFGIVFSAVAALLLFIPGRMVFKAIQRKLKSGSFLPSVEEIDKVRANRAKPGKRWQWILAAGLAWLNVVIWTVNPFLQHSRHRPPFGLTWMPAVMWWLTALIWTWQAFRKTPPQGEFPIKPDDRKPPSGGADQLLAQPR
jgi:hypothetical protein